MMKSIFLFLCMAVSSAMLGQIEANNGLQTQLVETWVNGAWQNSTRGTFTANDEGYNTSVLYKQWNVETSAWDINRQVSFFSEGDTQVSLNQNWDGENWVNSSKSTYYYDGGNEMAASMISQLWIDGAWQNQQRATNTYNEEENLTHVLYEIWDAENSDWQTYSQQNYTLNGDGQASVMLQQLYNPASATWADYQRQTNDYTNGHLSHSLYEIASPNWINSSEMTHTHDGQGRIHEVLMNVWNQATSTWNTGARITYLYDTLGTNEFSKSDFIIYPNPAADIITLSVTEPLQSVSVFSIDGRRFFLSPMNNQIDVSTLPAGVYILATETDSGRQNAKFIKQ